VDLLPHPLSALPVRDSPDAPQVIGRGGQNTDPGVRIVNPINWYFASAKPKAIGGDQEFGVEKPAVIFHDGQELECTFPAKGLEAALGVADLTVQGNLEQEIVCP
jgi:hypothetical protein